MISYSSQNFSDSWAQKQLHLFAFFFCIQKSGYLESILSNLVPSVSFRFLKIRKFFFAPFRIFKKRKETLGNEVELCQPLGPLAWNFAHLAGYVSLNQYYVFLSYSRYEIHLVENSLYKLSEQLQAQRVITDKYCPAPTVNVT